MGQAGDTRGPWWHRVTLVYAALVVAAPLLPPQVNRLQLQSPWGSARSQPGAPLHPFGASTSMCPGPSCSFRALLLLPCTGSACRALAGKWHRVWAAVMPSQARLAGTSQALPVHLLCMAFLIFCHERLQAGDLVLPLCPAWAAISAHTGNKSACLPGGGCAAPAASARISQSQITPGLPESWLVLFRSSELPQLHFCHQILPKALKCPCAQEQHLPAPSPHGQPCWGAELHQPWLLDATGSRTSLGKATSLNRNGICSLARSAQGQRSQAKYRHVLLSRGAAQSVWVLLETTWSVSP